MEEAPVSEDASVSMFLGRGESENVSSLIACFTAGSRLRKSLYFGVVKYARAVKQKVWNEAETRE